MLGLITLRPSGLLLSLSLLNFLLIIAIAEAEWVVLRDGGWLDGGQWLPFASLAAR